MSESNLHQSVALLIDQLERMGLLDALELSDEQIADSIWLALQMDKVEAVSEPKQAEEPDSSPIIEIQESEPQAFVTDIIEIQESEPQELVTEAEPTVSVITEESRDLTPEQPTIKGLPFQVPAAPSLLNVLQLGRALRPLMRKVPSLTQEILDEEATVNQIAERDVWLPVTKPEPERWLDLELVVEESDSAFIWRETVNELQQIFETQGAFRNVQVWSLLSTDTELKLVRRHNNGKPRQRQHRYRELIHPNRRGAVILVSDCTSRVWQNATIHQWLKAWSEHGPTTVLQLFPEWLWESTQLGTGRKLFGTALSPGVTNPRLVLENLPNWIPIDWKNSLVLPVIQPEPELLNNWCRVVSGASNARVPTFLFDLKFVRQQYYNHEQHYNQLTETESSTELSAENRVSRFLATASVTAQRLAGMMAAAPVNLSVVNLIRKTLLAKATPVHVAEVYMGGLLGVTNFNTQNSNHTKNAEQNYDFLPGVRQVLNQAMGRNETTAVLDAISRYIAEEIDRPIRSFRALLALLPQYEEGEREKVLPFAEVAVKVLENLGGEYAEFAQEVAQKIETTDNRSGQIDDLSEADEPISPEPQILLGRFEVAFLDIEDTVTFEFDVATLEEKRELFGLRRISQWVIQKQKQQTTGLIEDLGNGIQVELVKIPAGSFLMGSPRDELALRLRSGLTVSGVEPLERLERESPQHEVNVSSFFMGRYPITQIQWRTIVTQVPKIQRDLSPDLSRFTGDNRPVEQVSWYDAVEFCARLSKYTGQVHRLPSEAEWEYACRAGTTTPFHFGETITTDLANYNGDYTYGESPKGKYRRQTTPVGNFQVANAFGLHNMHGNVYEWCADPWHDNYKGAPNDSQVWDRKNSHSGQNVQDVYLVNFSEDSRARVIRGGSWTSYPDSCRSAYRNSSFRSNSFIGFRVVRVI